MARAAIIGWALALSLCVAAPALAQSPNVEVPRDTSIGNSNEGSGDAGGGSSSEKPKPVPRSTPPPRLPPRTMPTPAPTATGPAPRAAAPSPAAPRVSQADRERAKAAARERRRRLAAARRAARRDSRLRTFILRRTSCLSDVADVDRALLLLHAHPSGATARSRAEVARILGISSNGVAQSQARAMNRLRTLEHEGTCAPASGKLSTKMLAYAAALERNVMPGGGKGSQPKPKAKRSAAARSGGAASSALRTRPTGASADWTTNVLTGLEIFLLLAAAAWIGRAVWRVM